MSVTEEIALTSKQYSIARHVFVRRSGELVVLLDLKRNRYQVLKAYQALEVANLVRGWPVENASGKTSETGLAVIKALLKQGLVVEGIQAGKDASPVPFSPPSHEITPDSQPGSSRWTAFWVCLRASLIAKRALRKGRLEELVAKIQQQFDQRSGTSQPDQDTVRRLLGTFKQVRPLLFDSKDACLQEAFCLATFLAHYHIYPSWVFGVKTDPWGAHCWLQIEGSVLNVQNNSAEEARRYDPIMVAAAFNGPLAQ